MNNKLVTACPDDETLGAFELGKLTDEAWERCAEHVDVCTKCQNRLDEASSHNLFADVLRDAVEKSSGYSATVKPFLGDDSRHQDFVDGYRLLGRIGRGGMGEVYKAEHSRMKRTVAVKLLPASGGLSRESVSRFQREVEAAAKLVHRHIVTAYDAGEHLGRPFLVMEYVEGENLAEIVRRRGPLPIQQAVEFVRQAAVGLEYAHAQGVVHRDIKPSNILVSDEGVVKLLDLGLARVDVTDRQPIDDALTQSGHVMGTADYIAPEQARDSRAADHRADLYSLGCTLHFLLTGSAPFRGGSPLETMLAHVEQPAPDLGGLRADADRELVAIHRKLLEKDREDRFGSAGELIAALSRLPKNREASSDPIPPPIQVSQSDTKSFGAAPTLRSAPAIADKSAIGGTSSVTDKTPVADTPEIVVVPHATRVAEMGKSSRGRRYAVLTTLAGAVGILGLLLTVIVVITRQDQSVTVVDGDHRDTTIRIGTDRPEAKPQFGRGEERASKMPAPGKSLPTDARPAVVEANQSESRNASAGGPDLRQQTPFARLSQTITEIRDEIRQRELAGEFGVPADPARMQQAANDLVDLWQRDGRLPKEQRISIKYDPNGAFSFTATKGFRPDTQPTEEPNPTRDDDSSRKARGSTGTGGTGTGGVGTGGVGTGGGAGFGGGGFKGGGLEGGSGTDRKDRENR